MEHKTGIKQKFSAVLRFWRQYAFRYRPLWTISLLLQLGFFSISAILPFFFMRVIDSLTARDASLFAMWIAIYLGTEALQVVFMYTRGYAMQRLGVRVEQDLQVSLYKKFHSAAYEETIKVKTGDMLQRLTSDAPRCSPLIIQCFSELVGHIVLIAIIIPLMFIISPILAGISVVATLLYFFGYRVYQERAPHLAERRQKAEADYIAVAEEGLDALYSIRVQGALQGVMRRFSTAVRQYLEKGFAFYILTLKFQGGFTTMLTMISGAAVMITGAWLIFRGMTTVGALIAFTQYVGWLYVFTIFMSDFAAEIEPALVSLKRVEEVLSWPETWRIEVVKPPRKSLDHPHAIEIKHLNFAIEQLQIFRDLNMKIKSNRMTVILGKSGVGKSTLLNLLLKLYEVPKETIYLYGRDITEIPLDELLGLVSVVEQEPRFFSGSLTENLGLFSKATDKEKVEHIAQQLGIEKFIGSLQSKEMAAKLSALSGGERKRLGTLRGMLQDTPLVVMDEPTAFLDEATGLHILRNIRANFPHKTIVVFSHDPGVRSLCDEVIELYGTT